MAKNKDEKRRDSKKTGNAVVQGLLRVLANSYSLAVRSHIAHWNVEGPEFHSLHELFGEHHQELMEAADMVAERIRALDAYAPMTPGDLFAPAAPAKTPRNTREIIEGLHGAHVAASRLCLEVAEIADDEDDSATEDMLTALATAHDKKAWMLRSLLR